MLLELRRKFEEDKQRNGKSKILISIYKFIFNEYIPGFKIDESELDVLSIY